MATSVERRAERRAAIVATATRLFTHEGYDATSVNAVADALQMSVGGLYRYIETKSDLLVLVCDDIYGRLPDTLAARAAGPGEARERLREVAAAYLRACAGNRELILLMYREYRSLPRPAQLRYRERERAIAEVFRGLVEAVRAETGSDAGPAAELVAQNVVLLGHAPALKRWSLAQDGLELEATFDGQLQAIARMAG
jgi:AcrR family transcriptional regulator